MFFSNSNASCFIAFISPNIPALIPLNTEIGKEQKTQTVEKTEAKI